MSLRVTVWHEHRHEKTNEKVREVYPDGMHEAIAGYLRTEGDFRVRTALLDDPEHGLNDDVLENTDVMTWWGHMAHDDVDDAIVDKVVKRVHDGMGIVFLHSGHFSKPFKKLMGTTCDLKWRESNDREILWVTRPGHPILDGVADKIVIDKEEMYGEFFDIPEPDETILVSTFSGGECFRSGITYRRGAGSIFYFRPGHETYPSYHNKEILHVIANGLRWVGGKETKGDKHKPEFGNRKDGWIDA
ncbi:MAG: ThuA domain-containing protein [Planctomycetota bacterium]